MSVKIKEKDLYLFIINEFRYSIKQNTHFASQKCLELIQKYLPKMETSWQQVTANQLTEEIINERILYLPINKKEYYIYNSNDFRSIKNYQLKYDEVWENLMIFLVDYLDKLPYNYKDYLNYIYGHIVYSDGINFAHNSMLDKFKNKKAENRKSEE